MEGWGLCRVQGSESSQNELLSFVRFLKPKTPSRTRARPSCGIKVVHLFGVSIALEYEKICLIVEIKKGMESRTKVIWMLKIKT